MLTEFSGGRWGVKEGKGTARKKEQARQPIALAWAFHPWTRDKPLMFVTSQPASQIAR
jgi:hypothetical protein